MTTLPRSIAIGDRVLFAGVQAQVVDVYCDAAGDCFLALAMSPAGAEIRGIRHDAVVRSDPCNIRVGDHVQFGGICVPVIDVYRDPQHRVFLAVAMPPAGDEIRGIPCDSVERCDPVGP